MTVTLDIICYTWNKQENQMDVCRTTDNAHIETYYGYKKSLKDPLHIEGSTSIFFNILCLNCIWNVRSCFLMALRICNTIQTVIILQEQFPSTSIQCLSQNFFHRPDSQPFITGGQVASMYIQHSKGLMSDLVQ